MKAIRKPKTTDVAALLGERGFRIPKYQRSYSWGRNEVREFLQDLRENFETDNVWFLGILFSYDLDGADSALLDGQQRMTTVFVLLKELSLYKDIVLNKEQRGEFGEYADKHIHAKLFRKTTSVPKLTLDLANNSEFSTYLNTDSIKLAKVGTDKKSPQYPSHKALALAISMIRLWLKRYLQNNVDRTDDLVKFKELIDFVFSKLEMIEVKLTNEASYHEIFENLNDRGLRLTASDKFKNLCCLYADNLEEFEREWNQMSNKLFLAKRDLDGDIFDFYFRSKGIDDLKNRIKFIGTVRNALRIEEGRPREIRAKRQKYVFSVFDEIKDIANFVLLIQSGKLIELYQATKKGDKMVYATNVIQSLVALTLDKFPQYAVLAYAALLNFKNRSEPEAYRKFLLNLLTGVRFYVSADLSGKSANSIRPDTISIAGKLKSSDFVSILTAENGINYASRLKVMPIDALSSNDKKRFWILVFLIQAAKNPSLISEYNVQHKWSVEHLAPKSWTEHWSHLSQLKLSPQLSAQGKLLSEDLESRDLDEKSKFRIQEFLGNKFILSKKLNEEFKNLSLKVKQREINKLGGPVVLPDFVGLTRITALSSFGVNDILARTKELSEVLVAELKSRKLPFLDQ